MSSFLFHFLKKVRVKKFPPSFSIDEGSSTDPDKNLKCEVFTVRINHFPWIQFILLFQADQEIEFKWFSRPEDETDKTVMNLVCAEVKFTQEFTRVILPLFQTDDNDCSVPVAQPLFDKKDSNVPVSQKKTQIFQ